MCVQHASRVLGVPSASLVCMVHVEAHSLLEENLWTGDGLGGKTVKVLYFIKIH